MKYLKYRLPDIIKGLIIYSAGDTAASLMMHEFSVQRMLGIMFVGGFVYSLEIPAWFNCINEKYTGLQRTLMATLYFNPLWIARHLIFISLFSGQISQIHWSILSVALKSFATSLPVAFAANHVIQNKIPLQWRFFASAIFSSLMAIYYPLSRMLFK